MPYYAHTPGRAVPCRAVPLSTIDAFIDIESTSQRRIIFGWGTPCFGFVYFFLYLFLYIFFSRILLHEIEIWFESIFNHIGRCVIDIFAHIRLFIYFLVIVCICSLIMSTPLGYFYFYLNVFCARAASSSRLRK